MYFSLLDVFLPTAAICKRKIDFSAPHHWVTAMFTNFLESVTAVAGLSPWPRQVKKHKNAPKLSLKEKLFHLEPFPLSSGGDVVRCLLSEAGKQRSIFL